MPSSRPDSPSVCTTVGASTASPMRARVVMAWNTALVSGRVNVSADSAGIATRWNSGSPSRRAPTTTRSDTPMKSRFCPPPGAGLSGGRSGSGGRGWVSVMAMQPNGGVGGVWSSGTGGPVTRAGAVAGPASRLEWTGSRPASVPRRRPAETPAAPVPGCPMPTGECAPGRQRS